MVVTPGTVRAKPDETAVLILMVLPVVFEVVPSMNSIALMVKGT
jgi:hypothetical protein